MSGQIWFDENKIRKNREILLETGFSDLSFNVLDSYFCFSSCIFCCQQDITFVFTLLLSYEHWPFLLLLLLLWLSLSLLLLLLSILDLPFADEPVVLVVGVVLCIPPVVGISDWWIFSFSFYISLEIKAFLYSKKWIIRLNDF